MAKDFYDIEEDPTEQKVSRFNAAALINLILSDLWKDSYRHSRAGEFSKWNADLNCLWMELAGDVQPGSDEEKAYEIIETELANAGALNSGKKVTGFKTVSKDDMVSHSKQYRILMKKAVMLKRLQNKQGKGTAYQDSADDYMDF